MQPGRPKWQIATLISFAALLCGLLFLSPGFAFAQTDLPGANPPPDQLYQGDILCPHNWDGVTGRIVICIQNVVVTAAKNFLGAFLPAYEAILIAVMILAVTIFGALMMMGTIQRPSGETFFFIMKLAVISQFAVLFGGWIDHIFDIMTGLVAIVSNYITLSPSNSICSGGITAISHTFEMGRDASNPTYIWDRIDCLFLTLFGIGAGSAAGVGSAVLSNPIGVTSLAALLFFTGGIGLVIFVTIILLIIMLLLGVLRAMKIYLTSVIAIALLVCISPILIPLILFNHTRPIFDQWLKYLMQYMLIPVFMVAFMTMMVAGFDAVFFRGTSSLYYAIAGQHSQDQHFSMGYFLQRGIIGDAHTDTPSASPASQPVVGKNIPGTDAMAIMEYIALCFEPGDMEEALTPSRLEAAQLQYKEMCDLGRDKLEEMLVCAMNPVIPDGSQNALEDDESCADIEGEPYYGFARNEEILHFAIAPNIEPDSEVRKKQNEGCGLLSFCTLKKVGGAVLDVTLNVVGAVVEQIGKGLQFIGNALKKVVSFITAPCRLAPVPGGICLGVDKVLIFAADVTHKVGTAADFSGRVLQHGLSEVLGEMFESWFDQQALDTQKISSYRCAEVRGINTTAPVSYANYKVFLQCDDEASAASDPQGRVWGSRELLIEIIYIFVAGIVMAWLMYRVMDKIPNAGKQLIGTARMETTLPGEDFVSDKAQKAIHGLEKLKSPASRMMGKGGNNG